MCCSHHCYVTAEEKLQMKKNMTHNKQLATWQTINLFQDYLDSISKGEKACCLAITPRCTFIYKKALSDRFRGVFQLSIIDQPHE